MNPLRRYAFVLGWLIGCGAIFHIGSVSTYGASAQLLYKLTAPEPLPGGGFGEVLSVVDGDILVGEPRRVENGVQGRAYLFDGETGGFKMVFNNPEPVNLDIFARAISGGDGRVFVTTSGLQYRVYAFDRTTGQMTRRIDNPAGGGSSFGESIAYGKGTLLVGDPSFTIPFQQSIGRGYLFDSTTGALQKTLVNPQPTTGDLFGATVALVGDAAMLGSVTDRARDGQVWGFNRDSGSVQFILDNPNPESVFLDWFGTPIVGNEQIFVVGAQEDSTSGVENSGTAYVFDAHTRQLRHTLFSPQIEAHGEFGAAIALMERDDIAIGAWATDVDGIDSAGHAYLFDDVTGALMIDIPSPEPSFSAAFGWSVGAVGNRIVVGARNAMVNGLATGAVYVFAVVPEPGTLSLAVVFLLIMFSGPVARLIRSGRSTERFAK